MDIKEIILELKRHDDRHFKEFYDLTKKQVYFSAISIVNSSYVADDIVQDTYVNFLKHIDSFDEKRNVFAYLSTIARNLSINYYNKNKREIIDDEYVSTTKDEEKDIYAKQRVKDILSLLDNETEREVITYHVILEYKFKDIASIIDKPLGTVLWIYNKAIKKLQERMKNYEN